jgi:hypothetical protein
LSNCEHKFGSFESSSGLWGCCFGFSNSAFPISMLKFKGGVAMTDEIRPPYIPRRTRDEIQNPSQPGGRHHQAIRIAFSLLGQGLSEDAVFAQLRAMYERDVSDREIRDVVLWACGKKTQSCGNVPVKSTAPVRVTPDEAKRNTEAFLNGWHCTIAQLWHASPWHPSEDWRKDASQLIAALYEPNDNINVVTAFTIQKQRDGSDKACPRGGGKTLVRDEWLKRLRIARTPCSDAGAWIRPNPVKGLRGSGCVGAYTDADVASYRFLLLESDSLPIGMQLSLWSRLALPVATIIDSGGRSVHAWIKVDCADDKEYREIVSEIYELLARFGVCPANRNPSRLSRLPGVKRSIGGIGACEQCLFYLNDEPEEEPIFGDP